MTDTELEALAVRVANGYDYLSKQEYEGPEFNRVWATYAGLCEQLRVALDLPDLVGLTEAGKERA